MYFSASCVELLKKIMKYLINDGVFILQKIWTRDLRLRNIGATHVVLRDVRTQKTTIHYILKLSVAALYEDHNET